MNEELSAVQRKMLAELQNFIAKHGYPPTVGELAEKLKRTKASIHGTLDKLITKGFIRRTHGKARSIEIIRTQRANVIDVVAVPMLGNIPAGAPISTEESRSDAVYVQADVVGDALCFALSYLREGQGAGQYHPTGPSNFRTFWERSTRSYSGFGTRPYWKALGESAQLLCKHMN